MRRLAVRGLAVTAALVAFLVVRSQRDVTQDVAAGDSPVAEAMSTLPSASWDDADWEVFEAKVRWIRDERLDTLSLGGAMAALGRTFVGTAYVPHTLEADGPEALVINFRGLDCVTFVETVFALSRFTREAWAPALMGDRAEAEDRYEALLTELRYREARLDGYASRLHYFTDWVEDNEAKGLVVDMSRELGGVRDDEPIDFMTTHADAYRQMADPANTAEIRAAEERLTRAGRFFVPADRIAAASPGIQDGDVIAATSTVAGLDVAHTGLALWVDGELHMLHAPLVGEAVQISEVSLVERILRIGGQDGIIVARPVER